MIDRRRILIGGAALVLAAPAFAGEPRWMLSGSLEQASRILGRVPPGAKVTLDGTALSVSPSGDFVFGLAYDRKEPAILAATFADGTVETRSIAPVERTYEIQRIDGLQPEYVAPPPDILDRIKAENDKIHAACEADCDLNGFAAVFEWPVAGILSSWFGSQRILNGVPKAPHYGVDVAAPEDTPIRAPSAGVVRLAEPDFYMTGGTTVIDHGHGLFTAYYHQNAVTVTVGQAVACRDVIGAVGKKGRATGPHLHWSMNWFHLPLDPSRATASILPPRT